MLFVQRYNLSNLSSNYDYVGTLNEVNSLAHGMLGIMTCFAIFLLLLLALKTYETSRAFAAASFITTILGTFFFIMGFIPMIFETMLVIMTIVAYKVLLSENG